MNMIGRVERHIHLVRVCWIYIYIYIVSLLFCWLLDFGSMESSEEKMEMIKKAIAKVMEDEEINADGRRRRQLLNKLLSEVITLVI